jgi:16S rRNA (cytosine967-C5)-methyltransferase
MTPGARLQAVIDTLDEIARTSKPVDRQLRDWGRSHRFAGSKDRAAIAERVYDILRHRSTFAWRMGGDTPRALVIAALLQEGADPGPLFTGGYAPAPLSDAELAAIASSPGGEPPLHVRGEYPQVLEGELARAFGAALADEMIALRSRAPADLRVNTLKGERGVVLMALRAEGHAANETPFSPMGIRIATGEAKLGRGALFESGAFEFQDEAAQCAALLCGAKPGMRVLDIAAGAGGKSLALAAIMQNEGEIVATDIRPEALIELERRAARAGATITKTLPRPQEVGERAGVRAPQTPNAIVPPPHPDPLPLKGREGMSDFDVVLLDAPCSGTGTWRRQPELRWRLTPERLEELKATQDMLLAQAAVRVKPGGRLVYATCSILPCENEDRIEAFCKTHPHFTIVPAADVWRESVGANLPPGLGHFFNASPHSTGTDGFFTAVMQRKAHDGDP